MQKRVALIASAWLAWSCASQPQTIAKTAVPIVVAVKSSRPEPNAGFDRARLARIDERMRQAVADGSLPGALSLVARGGRVVHYEQYGFRDREQKAPMTKDTLFRVFSMTKPITSVAVMMLYEE